MNLRYQISILALALVTGCSQTRHVPMQSLPSLPLHTEADAGLVATNFALKQGIKLREYQQLRVLFDSVLREWHFLYMLRPPGMPGGHFTITVDENGKTRFMGGA
jgi:hypothetical protein